MGGLLVDKADLGGLDCFKEMPPDEEDLPTGEVEEREDRDTLFLEVTEPPLPHAIFCTNKNVA